MGTPQHCITPDHCIAQYILGTSSILCKKRRPSKKASPAHRPVTSRPSSTTKARLSSHGLPLESIVHGPRKYLPSAPTAYSVSSPARPSTASTSLIAVPPLPDPPMTPSSQHPTPEHAQHSSSSNETPPDPIKRPVPTPPACRRRRPRQPPSSSQPGHPNAMHPALACLQPPLHPTAPSRSPAHSPPHVPATHPTDDC